MKVILLLISHIWNYKNRTSGYDFCQYLIIFKNSIMEQSLTFKMSKMHTKYCTCKISLQKNSFPLDSCNPCILLVMIWKIIQNTFESITSDNWSSNFLNLNRFCERNLCWFLLLFNLNRGLTVSKGSLSRFHFTIFKVCLVVVFESHLLLIEHLKCLKISTETISPAQGNRHAWVPSLMYCIGVGPYWSLFARPPKAP